MHRSIKRLINACGLGNPPPPGLVRRQSLIFEEGRALPNREHDTSAHRRHYHYYEDLLS